MFKRFALVFALALAINSTSTATAHAWSPEPGALFNNPWGPTWKKERLIKKFVRAVNHTKRGSTIRIATYSNDRVDIADALIAAHKRGVRVKILLNDNWTSRQTERLQNRLGSDVSKASFLRICRSSCRGEKGNLHSKFYLFTRTGTSDYVSMFGSANLTGYGAKNQWNDMYTTVKNGSVHGAFREIFEQMKRDRAMAHPYRSVSANGGYDLNFYPRYGTTKADDPIMRRLDRVRCTGATGATGVGDKTLIRISMYGWNGDRGRYLADKVARLSRNGCAIRVIHSDGGGYVVSKLRSAGVRVRTASYDRNRNGTIDMYTHQKYMVLSGRYSGSAGWHVWTGSQNWSDRAVRGDETTVHIPRRGAATDYFANFKAIWENHTHIRSP